MSAKKILIVSANPKQTGQLRLSEEVRQIEAMLRASQHRDRFDVETCLASRPIDVQQAMLDEQPQIVHFCGHGLGGNGEVSADARKLVTLNKKAPEGLILEDDAGKPKVVSGAALAGMFSCLDGRGIECVILNTCYSEVQAASIVKYVPYVIGMNQPIGDQAALKFSEGFYQALGNGESIEFAHRWGCNTILMDGLNEALTPVLLNAETSTPKVAASATPSATKPKIFISYKRDCQPDEPVALQISQALGQSCEVALDQKMSVGTEWMGWIDQQLEQSDYLVVVLSEVSVRSEMVRLEIEKARKLFQQNGKPQILPVRLNYREPFQYPLSEYLNPINWAFWAGDTDTEKLIAELEQAIAGEALSLNSDVLKAAVVQQAEPEAIPAPQPMAQPTIPARSLEMPEGTMDLESQFYIERDSDRIALETIERPGVTLTIKGPRQMGKSSLLNRVMQAAGKAGKQVVFLDFQLFDSATLQDGDRFFQEFCLLLTDELDLEDKVAEYWQRPVSNGQRCTRYVGRHLLKQLEGPVVLAMDEVESIFDTRFRSDFFSMLRSWHNSRAMQPLWKRLDLALVTSTEPYQLIADLNQSPFNVGQVIELGDFDLAQVAVLNQQHGEPFSGAELQRLMGLVHGQPYLIRRALYEVASGQMTVAQLFKAAMADRGPFGDHLRYHLFRMYDKPELVAGLLQVIRRPCSLDEAIFFRLRGAGLVRREGQQVVPRCELYAKYFQEHLHG